MQRTACEPPLWFRTPVPNRNVGVIGAPDIQTIYGSSRIGSPPPTAPPFDALAREIVWVWPEPPPQIESLHYLRKENYDRECV